MISSRMRPLSRAAVFLLLLWLLRSPAAFATPSGAIVTIYSHSHKRGPTQGTGFVLGSQGQIVTAYHVVQDSYEIDILGNGIKGYFKNVTVEYIDPDHDIAILGSSESQNISGLKPVQTAPSSATAISVLGSPNGISGQTLSGQITSSGTVSSLVIKAIDQGQNDIFAKNIDVYLIALDAVYGGISGAPIIGADNTVIGIYSGSYNQGGSLGWAIPMKYAQSLLSQPALHKTASQVPDWPPLSLMAGGVWNKQLRSYSKPYTTEHITKLMILGQLLTNLQGTWVGEAKLRQTLSDGIQMGICQADTDERVSLTFNDIDEDVPSLNATIEDSLNVVANISPNAAYFFMNPRDSQIQACFSAATGDATAYTSQHTVKGATSLSISQVANYANNAALSGRLNVTDCQGTPCKPDVYGMHDIDDIEIISDDKLRWGENFILTKSNQSKGSP